MKLKEYFSNKAWKGTLTNVGMKIVAVKPEIMLVTGCLSVLGGTIYACMKSDEAKKAFKKAKEDKKTAEEETEIINDPDVTVLPEAQKQMRMERGKRYAQVYGKLIYDLVKVYGIPALLWFGGMGMIFQSHGDLRKTNKHLIADGIAAKKLFDEYRGRVAKAVGEETEQKIFMGVQEGTVNILEKDQKTGEEKIVQKKVDVFHAQPGSIFARNFTEETSDAFDIRSFADYYLESRIDAINKKLELGVYRAYTGMDILRELGYNEDALGEDENIDALIRNGISGNARKVPDPEMRKLKVTRLRGYQKKWDPARNIEVYVPCLRLDFNFYPLEGKI